MKIKRPRFLLVVSLVLASSACSAASEPVKPDRRLRLMPLPAEYHLGAGRLAITSEFAVAASVDLPTPLQDAVARLTDRWQARTGLLFPKAMSRSDQTSLIVEVQSTACPIPQLGEDESYTLDVTPAGAVLRAPNRLGVLHGLETLGQMLETDGNEWFVPAISIQDRPRFPWRGLLIDVARHWLPPETIRREVDGMALVKLNVLHLHLTDDQGFRIESKIFPRLHELGSDGDYYTQEQMRALVAYAAARGIRIVPEFDLPAHATSWLAGYPEFGSAPGPYRIERRWGIFDPVFNPANESVYPFLARFFAEMVGLFPDHFLHLGGDENNGRQWTANPDIQRFMREHHFRDPAALQGYFTGQVARTLQQLHKLPLAYDEAGPYLPAEAVTEVWHENGELGRTLRAGRRVIFSAAYYLDLNFSAATHYAADPAGAIDGPEDATHLLGAEATIWTEWISPETIDSRLWPRAAAIAERFWSPRETRDSEDMYRRLAIVSRRLEEAGLQHRSQPAAMLRRFAGDTLLPDEQAALLEFAAIVEPVKDYRRLVWTPGGSQLMPLSGFVDCVAPDSATARAFSTLVQNFLDQGEKRDARQLETQLLHWKSVGRRVARELAPKSPRIAEIAPLAAALAEACGAALEVLASSPSAPSSEANRQEARLAVLQRAAKIRNKATCVELAVIPALAQLVTARGGQPRPAGIPR